MPLLAEMTKYPRPDMEENRSKNSERPICEPRRGTGDSFGESTGGKICALYCNGNPVLGATRPGNRWTVTGADSVSLGRAVRRHRNVNRPKMPANFRPRTGSASVAHQDGLPSHWRFSPDPKGGASVCPLLLISYADSHPSQFNRLTSPPHPLTLLTTNSRKTGWLYDPLWLRIECG